MADKNFNGRIKMKSDTTENWKKSLNFIPLKGEILVYLDYATKEENGKIVNIPNFKVGDGLAYGIDLPFVGDNVRAEIEEHIKNSGMHITGEERIFWNNKLNCEDEVDGEVLILNRN